jgi:hypothetical protein
MISTTTRSVQPKDTNIYRRHQSPCVRPPPELSKLTEVGDPAIADGICNDADKHGFETNSHRRNVTP